MEPASNFRSTTPTLLIAVAGALSVLIVGLVSWSSIGSGTLQGVAILIVFALVVQFLWADRDRKLSIGVGASTAVIAIVLLGLGLDSVSVVGLVALVFLTALSVGIALFFDTVNTTVTVLPALTIALLSTNSAAIAGVVVGLLAYSSLMQAETFEAEILQGGVHAEMPSADPQHVTARAESPRPTDHASIPAAVPAALPQERVEKYRSSADSKPAGKAEYSSEDFYPTFGQASRSVGQVGDLGKQPFPFAPAVTGDHLKAGDLSILARSHRGSSHIHSGDHRQDSYALATTNSGSHAIVAVADGLGSAAASHVGSFWAARYAVALVAEALDNGQELSKDIFGKVFDETAKRMSATASQLGHTEGDQIASTIVMSVVPTAGDSPAHVARVGDSDVMALNSGHWRSVFGDDGADKPLETGATNVLPHQADRVEHQLLPLGKAECVLVATDGVSRVIEGAPNEVGGPFAETLAKPCSELEFQALIGFVRRGAHDDRTAVAIWSE